MQVIGMTAARTVSECRFYRMTAERGSAAGEMASLRKRQRSLTGAAGCSMPEHSSPEKETEPVLPTAKTTTRFLWENILTEYFREPERSSALTVSFFIPAAIRTRCVSVRASATALTAPWYTAVNGALTSITDRERFTAVTVQCLRAASEGAELTEGVL